MTFKRVMLTAAIACTAWYTEVAYSDVQDYWSFEEWEQAVGEFTTIDFTGHDDFTIITDEYSDLGVQFADGNDFVFEGPEFVNDSWGLHGNWGDLQITIEFDEPQMWIGIDHPGDAAFDLYYQSSLIESIEFSQNGPGNFSGVVSTVAFDRVVVWRTTDTAPLIDDLHFGIPTPGAIAVLALAGLLGTGSRRRRG